MGGEAPQSYPAEEKSQCCRRGFETAGPSGSPTTPRCFLLQTHPNSRLGISDSCDSEARGGDGISPGPGRMGKMQVQRLVEGVGEDLARAPE